MKSTNVGIIGLGVIGKRMAKNMVIHPKFRVIGGYDVNENKRSEFKHECKGIKVVSTAEELLSNPKLDLLYVGTPPASHACLLYTSPSPRDLSTSRMPSSA